MQYGTNYARRDCTQDFNVHFVHFDLDENTVVPIYLPACIIKAENQCLLLPFFLPCELYPKIPIPMFLEDPKKS